MTNDLAPNIFYSGLPEDEQLKWYAKIKTHAFAPLSSKATAASWQEIPTWYLLCENDNAIPPSAQGRMTDGVRALGGEIEVERIGSGHSPFLTHPDEVVNWIRRAAGETV